MLSSVCEDAARDAGSYQHLTHPHLCHTCAGECETEVEKLCKDVEQGEGKLAECLSSAIAESESGAEGGSCLMELSCS